MLNDLYNKNIYNYKDINSLIDPNVFYRYLIPPHINLLAKNGVGYKNLFKIVSDSLTNHFYSGNARALKSIIDKNREGILIGSGCVNGNVFELALNRSDDELKDSVLGILIVLADKFIENQDLKNKVIDVIKMEITILHDYVTSHEKEWLEQGKIEGKLEGKEEEKLKIAKNMHKENYSVKEIAKITKLDCKTIEKLK